MKSLQSYGSFWRFRNRQIHNLPWFGGICISSKSPWVNAISHQITANANHERKKLKANTRSVQRHCESTKVVKMSCRKRILRWAIFFWITLHSPFFKTARRRIFLELPGRYPRLLGNRICYFRNTNGGFLVGWMKKEIKLQIVQFRLMFIVSYQMWFSYEESHYDFVCTLSVVQTILRHLIGSFNLSVNKQEHTIISKKRQNKLFKFNFKKKILLIAPL